MVRSGETAVLHEQVIVVLLLFSATLTSAHQRSKQDVARGATPSTLLQVLRSPNQTLPFANVIIIKNALVSLYRKAPAHGLVVLVSCRLGSRFARQTSPAAEMASI